MKELLNHMGNIVFCLSQIIRFQRFTAVLASMLLTLPFSTFAFASSGSLDATGLYGSKGATPAT